MSQFKPKRKRSEGHFEKVEVIDYDNDTVLIRMPWGQIQRVKYNELLIKESDAKTIIDELGPKNEKRN